VKERTAALQQINEELDTFLYQSSHALRRPIVTIMGLLQIARMEKNYKSLHDIYSKIDNTAIRMDLMLRKLVMVSEINFSKNDPEYIDFEIILGEIWSSLSSTLNSGSMKLILNIEQDVNYVADRKMVFMMLENIFENSILYHIESVNNSPYLEISIISKTTNIIIEVKDNGIGIPEQAIGKVFEMFTVANDTGKGFGLGLYIVKKSIL
jgi:signal transduction histidine kinase